MRKTFVGYPAVLGLSVLTATAATIAVPPGGDLQSALNSAHAGDVITLAPGATYKGPIALPANAGPGYITIRSAADSSLPAAGARVTPAYGSALAKVVSDGTAGLPVIRTTPGSSHYQFIGLEITPTAGAFILQLVQLGDGDETSLSQLPSDFVFDRCYLHGDPAVGARRGVAMNAPNITIMNSYLSDFKLVGPDSQALASWNGPGPLTITNNYLEGAGENVLIGGQDPTIANLVPTGITIRRNYFSKPLAWRVGDPAYQGTHWTVKNLLEFKNARQIVVDGNLFENNWADAQSGFAVLFTPRNQDGTAPWSGVADATFTNNIVQHVASGINILGTDDIYVSQQLHNVVIQNNLFADITPNWGGTARSFQILNNALNVTIDHNTGFAAGAILVADQLPSPGLHFTNNLEAHGGYGVFGSGVAEGSATLASYFPNSVFARNGIIGGNASVYPAGGYFPADINAVGFVNSGSGNYQLLDSSLLHNAGTDGTDIGVNVSQLSAAQSGAAVIQPTTPTPTTPVSTSPTGPARFEQNNAAVQYTGNWLSNSGAFNSGGSATIATDAGSQAKFTFTGTGAQWIGYRDPWSGIAKVYVDGVLKATIDTYSAASQAQNVIYAVSGLSNASHDLTLVVTGTRNPAAGGAWIWVDAFDVTDGTASATQQPQASGSVPPTPVRIQENDPAVKYVGVWSTNTSSSGNGEATVLSMDAGACATVTFTGTSVTWIGYRDQWSGIARVYVDGAMQATVDTYATPSQTRAVLYTASGLASGVHTLTIEVAGSHNVASGGNWVWLDSFDVTH